MTITLEIGTALLAILAPLTAAISFISWKRQIISQKRMEIVQQMLLILYRLQEKLVDARQPLTVGSNPNEIRKNKLIELSDCINEFRAKRHEFRVQFLDLASDEFKEIEVLYNDFFKALVIDEMLDLTSDQKKEQLLKIYSLPSNDEYGQKFDEAIKKIERFLREGYTFRGIMCELKHFLKGDNVN